jgi:hypothetical protein
MQNLVSTPFSIHFKLTKEMCPKTQEDIEYMSRVPYSSTIGSFMYAMVCTRPNISHAVGVVRKYMKNPDAHTPSRHLQVERSARS